MERSPRRGIQNGEWRGVCGQAEGLMAYREGREDPIMLNEELIFASCRANADFHMGSYLAFTAHSPCKHGARPCRGAARGEFQILRMLQRKRAGQECSDGEAAERREPGRGMKRWTRPTERGRRADGKKENR